MNPAHRRGGALIQVAQLCAEDLVRPQLAAEGGTPTSLVQTYFRLGGTQVQFNMIDTEVLRAAQRNPDAYRDLVVRISGYSALFTELIPRAQEEIISRAEYCT
jgi:pyruvate-formate lyase